MHKMISVRTAHPTPVAISLSRRVTRGHLGCAHHIHAERRP
jgi:hypothetical protein